MREDDARAFRHVYRPSRSPVFFWIRFVKHLPPPPRKGFCEKRKAFEKEPFGFAPPKKEKKRFFFLSAEKRRKIPPMDVHVQRDIYEVIFDLFPSIAPFVPSAPQPSEWARMWPDGAPRALAPEEHRRPKYGLTMRRKPPFNQEALRCVGFCNRRNRIIYHARRVGATRDVLVDLSVERVVKLQGVYWARAVARMHALLGCGWSLRDFPEEMHGAVTQRG
jgi:hypothetical protein